MEIDVRPYAGGKAAFAQAVTVAFSERLSDEEAESFGRILEIDRAIVACEGERIVGTACALSLELTVPGAVLPIAGVSMVGVPATHRRRGILRRMMRMQLEDVRARGEALAGLWASEAAIYGRFGYGLATLRHALEVERHRSAFRRPAEPPEGIRFVDDDEARRLFPTVLEAARTTTPGFFGRDADFWEAWTFHLPSSWREGLGAAINVVHERDGAADGYLRYAIRSGDARELVIEELLAAEPATRLALWRYALDVDLMRKVESWNVPVDDPILLAMADPRAANLKLGDGLWLRIVDVAGALEGRRYLEDGHLVLDIADDFAEWTAGRWALDVDEDGVGHVSTTEDDPDLRLGIDDLAAPYLGGISWRQLAAAGRVEELRPGAVATADALFRTDRAPWCPAVF